MLKFQRGETVYYKEIPNDMYNWQPVIKAYRVDEIIDVAEPDAKEMFLETVKRLNEGKFVQIGVNGIGEPYSITFFERYDDYFMKIEIL